MIVVGACSHTSLLRSFALRSELLCPKRQSNQSASGNPSFPDPPPTASSCGGAYPPSVEVLPSTPKVQVQERQSGCRPGLEAYKRLTQCFVGPRLPRRSAVRDRHSVKIGRGHLPGAGMPGCGAYFFRSNPPGAWAAANRWRTQWRRRPEGSA